MSTDVRALVVEYVQAVGQRRFDRFQQLLHPDVEFGGATAVQLQGAASRRRRLPQARPGHRPQRPQAAHRRGRPGFALYDFVTDTDVGPVLTGEFLTVQDGQIRSITLLFDWRRWPEVLQELQRRTADPAVADA
jgi:hypothetical protein